MKEYVEWRACAADDGDLAPETYPWTRTRELAEEDMREALNEADPPYDDVWLEKRTVAESDPERLT